MSRLLSSRVSCSKRYACLVPKKFSTSPLAVFLNPGSAEFLTSVTDVDSFPKVNRLPEVVVTGRANVGKSSLLNAVLGRKDLLFTSKKAGHTQALNFFRVGPHPGKLVVVDTPGYGSRGRPEWGTLLNHYVTTREELRRVYVLVSGRHGLRATDEAMLVELDAQVRQSGGTKFTLQAIITKGDQVGNLGREHVDRMRDVILQAAPTCLPPIITACPSKGAKFGIELVRRSIIDCCGL